MTKGQGLVVRASALRVKYRKGNKVRVRIESMGVHPKNRGRVYPAGIRVKRLCGEAVVVGFVKEDVGHNCVAVEEPPGATRSTAVAVVHPPTCTADPRTMHRIVPRMSFS